MADLADHAFAHSCAVLGRGDVAVEVASTAVRRGGRSRWAVLGHARAESLARAEGVATADLDGPVPGDLADVAAALAATRPALERAIVDLDARHDLDRSEFARALGLSVGPSEAIAAAVSADWHDQLDPILLAHLGPADCEGLASAIDAARDPPLRVTTPDPTENGEPADQQPPMSLRQLIQTGPAVAHHAAQCPACRDRLRSMVSVRTLLSQRAIEGLAPPAVRAAAVPSRLRRPTPPPNLEEASPSSRLRAIAIGAAVVLLATAAVVSSMSLGGDDPGEVDALTSIPALGSALAVEPASLQGATPPPVLLTSRADRALDWVAETDVKWLRVEPAGGTIAAGSTAELRVGVTPDAPEGDVSGSVRIRATDGSDTMIRLATTVERPPQLAASVEGCNIAATADDEGEVRAVELHWTTAPADERVVAMEASGDTFVGRIPVSPPPLTWWVTASDARGNSARTHEESVVTLTCA